MSDLDFEIKVSQNPLLGGYILYQFSQDYFSYTSEEEYPCFFKSLLVLPMVFHTQTVKSIFTMRFTSGLEKAILDKPQIKYGLQQRIVDLSSLSFSSINMMSSANMISLKREEKTIQIIPAYRRKRDLTLLEPSNDEIKNILKATARLGCWFSKYNTEVIYSLLNVRL